MDGFKPIHKISEICDREYHVSQVRQDDFEKFMTVKHKKSYYLAQIDVYLTFLLKRCPFYAAASVTAWR